MNATELRINNLVEISNEEFHKDATGLIMIVTGIRVEESEYFPESKHSVSLLHGHFTYSQMEEFIKPIALTEEWLVKFGAEKKEHRTFPSYNIDGIEFNFIGGKWREYVSQIEIKGVHHLQNIFYFRKDYELNLKK